MVVRQMVDGTSALAHAAADTVVGVGDGVMGGVVGAFTGAVQGASEGLGVRATVSPSTAMVASGVAAGLLGLVDWPLLALAGGTALVVRQLNGPSTQGRRRPSASRSGGAPAAAEATLRVEAPSATGAGGRAARNGTVEARATRGGTAKRSASGSRRAATKKSSASTSAS